VTLSDILGSADLGESPMHFCYSRQVAIIWEKKIGIRIDRKCLLLLLLLLKIGIRMNRKWLLLLLRREAVLRKIRLQGENTVVKRNYGLYIVFCILYIVSTHLGLVTKL
jgi:hypothetical protein